MAKKHVIFRLTAFSAAAGKYNPEAPLDGNEDNFYVDDDLNDNIPGRFQTDEDITMSDCGCLMVVADGMGGMNAGEVASAIAIETVKDFFAPGKISPKLAESPVERRKYLELVIKEADCRIKTDAIENPTHEGIGSTIILAWIVEDKMTISWCGDSRAYRFNPVNGLELLSTDHSYVQELVDKGVLSYEDTFNHPQGNIVTRSLGDPNGPARPETRQFKCYDNDILLLCSDGLSGVLRDRKTLDNDGKLYPGENIEDVIAANCSSLAKCRDALMAAAERADWYDNVTICLYEVLSGAGKVPIRSVAVPLNAPSRWRTIAVRSLILLLVLAGIFAVFVARIRLAGEADDNGSGDSVFVVETVATSLPDTTIHTIEPESVVVTPRHNNEVDLRPQQSIDTMKKEDSKKNNDELTLIPPEKEKKPDGEKEVQGKQNDTIDSNVKLSDI